MEKRYDSFGLLSYKYFSTDYTIESFATNVFDSGRGILYRYWDLKHLEVDTFIFNNYGKVIESCNSLSNRDGSLRRFRTYYYYDNFQKVTKIQRVHAYNNYKIDGDKELFNLGSYNEYQVDLYYTDKTIDSTITKYKYFNYPEKNHKSVTYYDDRGLCLRTVHQDSIVINYKHIKRNSKKL